MTNTQRAKLDSYNRIINFDNKYADDLSTIDDYAGIESSFNKTVGNINTAAGMQTQQSGTDDEAVSQAKTNMAQLVVKFALRGSVKARLAGNTTLANQLDEPVTYILKTPKTTAVLRANELRNYMNDNLTTLTNIKAGDIADIDAAIKAYNDTKDDPVQSQQSKKAGGTDVLPGLFTNADKNADDMFSLVRSYFADNTTMVEEMQLAMQIIDTGIRHTGVQITAVADESGAVLPDATVHEAGSDKTYQADEAGIVHIGSHRNGKFTFTISSKGRQDVALTATIVRGTKNEFAVRLKSLVS